MASPWPCIHRHSQLLLELLLFALLSVAASANSASHDGFDLIYPLHGVVDSDDNIEPAMVRPDRLLDEQSTGRSGLNPTMTDKDDKEKGYENLALTKSNDHTGGYGMPVYQNPKKKLKPEAGHNNKLDEDDDDNDKDDDGQTGGQHDDDDDDNDGDDDDADDHNGDDQHDHDHDDDNDGDNDDNEHKVGFGKSLEDDDDDDGDGDHDEHKGGFGKPKRDKDDDEHNNRKHKPKHDDDHDQGKGT